MSVRADKNGFIADVTDGALPKGRQRRRFKTHEEAKAWEEMVRAALKLGLGQPVPSAGREPIIGRKHPLALYEERIDHQKDAEKSLRRAELYWNFINGKIVKYDSWTVRPDTGIAAWEDNGRTPADFVSYLRGQDKAPGTINRYLSAASALLDCAVELGWLKEKPKIPWQKESKGRLRVISDEEMKKLKAWFNDNPPARYCYFFWFLRDTGCRLSEALEAYKELGRKVGDQTYSVPSEVKFKNTKNGEDRNVPLTQQAGLLFYETAPINEADFRKAWNSARASMGLQDDPEFTPHALRHTFCSKLIAKGVPLPTVAALAGHRSIKTTMRYVHMLPGQLEDAIAKLEEK